MAKTREKAPKLKPGAWKNTLRLYAYIKPHQTRFYIGLFFLFLTGLTAIVFPKSMGDMLDAAKQPLLQDLNKVGLFLLLIFVLQAVFSFFRIYLFSYVAEHALVQLRTDVYAHLVKLPMSFFNSRRVGELNSRISNDVSLIQDTFTTTIAEFLRQIIIILGGSFYLFTISIKLSMFMLAIIPVVSVLAVVFGKYIKKFSKLTQDKLAESNVVVEESLQGISVVKSFTNELFEVLRYKNSLKEVLELSIKSALWRGAFASFIIFCLFGAIISVVWYGSYLVQTTGELSMGQLIAFILYTVFIGASVGGIATLYTQIIKAVGATESLLEILDESAEKVHLNTTKANKIQGDVELSHVLFNYPNRADVEVLKDVSFHVKAGQTLALVGGSGSGKSTIASLIFGFYQINQGKILIDQKEITSYDLTALREQIGVVPQDTLLFGGSIEENIRYGKPMATLDEIIQASKVANAFDFIDQMPEKFQTIVGERGVQLSGGQRQRIAIARAVLKNPSILILDEATSALDSESEKLVQDALEKIMKGRTAIVIAHRLSTIQKADQIVVLEQGKIKEIGTHDELLQKTGGAYRKMVELQRLQEAVV